MIRLRFPLFVLALLLLVFVAPADAHPGHYHPPEEVDEFADEAFMVGLKHPFTGLDHLLAALAVGALAVGMGRQQGSAMAGVFFAGLAFGYAAGYAGYAMPMLESGLALAVLALGVLMMFQSENGMAWRLAVLAVIGIWNGSAHGMETANQTYGIGLLSGTALIAIIGATGAALVSLLSPQAPRFAGAAMAVAGLALAASRLM